MKKKNQKSPYATLGFESIRAPKGEPKVEPKATKASSERDLRAKGAKA